MVTDGNLGLLAGDTRAAFIGDTLITSGVAHEHLVHAKFVLEVGTLDVLRVGVRHFALIVGARGHREGWLRAGRSHGHWSLNWLLCGLTCGAWAGDAHRPVTSPTDFNGRACRSLKMLFVRNKDSFLQAHVHQSCGPKQRHVADGGFAPGARGGGPEACTASSASNCGAFDWPCRIEHAGAPCGALAIASPPFYDGGCVHASGAAC